MIEFVNQERRKKLKEEAESLLSSFPSDVLPPCYIFGRCLDILGELSSTNQQIVRKTFGVSTCGEFLKEIRSW